MIILCVDDDPDDVEVFCDALKQVDGSAKCIAAYNGEQALNILKSGLLPDNIFLDINMPKMNGMQTLKSIRKDNRLKRIPIIIYSTNINSTQIDILKKEGANDFLVKPGKFNDLVDALNRMIQ